MWRTRLPLGLLVLVASCQPTGDGNETDPLGEVPPISDFPRTGENSTVHPVTTGSGSVPAPTTPATPGGTTSVDPRTPAAGAVGGAAAPPTGPAPASGGGVSGSLDAGIPASSSGDAGRAPPAEAMGDAGAGDGAVPDAGEAGCPRLLAPDSGICSAYGCALSLDQLRASANPAGACTSAPALSAACDGSASSAALRCTEASVFSADLSAAASACVTRDAHLSALSSACRDCFVAEALCTLSRCFASCALASETDTCRACRRQQCAGALHPCTGLPAP